MNNADALCALRSTGTIVILDFPAKAVFGVDTHRWVTGELFQGVKLLPYGIHLVSYGGSAGAMGEEASTAGLDAPICSFFVNLTREQPVAVYHWCPRTDSLVYLADVAEADGGGAAASARLAAGVARLEFDKRLGVCPPDAHAAWAALLPHAAWEDVERVRPARGQHVRDAALAAPSEAERAAMQGVLAEEDGDPHGVTAKLFFATPGAMPAGLSPAEVTRWNMDATARLVGMATGAAPAPVKCLSDVAPARLTPLLGELEISFVLFAVAHSHAAFDAWKRLVCLVLSAEAATGHAPFAPFFAAVCTTLEGQVQALPDDFAVQEGGSFLSQALGAFKEITDPPAPAVDGCAELREAVDSLMRVASTRLGPLEEYDEGNDGDGY